MRCTLPRVFGAGAAVGGLAMTAGALYEAGALRRDERRFPAPGRLVDVGGRRLHVLTESGEGRDGPSIILECGMGAPSEVWTWICRGITEFAPTLVYDRAGLGRSDAARRPRSAELATDDLNHVLSAEELPGPYILVGHSYGGLLIRHFAHRYPDRVAGLVFVDAAHPEQLVRSHRQRMGLGWVEQYVRSSGSRAMFGLLRATARPDKLRVSGLPENERASALAMYNKRAHWLATYGEFQAWTDTVEGEVRDTTPAADLPVAVLTAGLSAESDPTHLELQGELARLSANGTHEVVDGAGHFELLTDPEYAGHVVEAIAGIWRSARAGNSPVTEGA